MLLGQIKGLYNELARSPDGLNIFFRLETDIIFVLIRGSKLIPVIIILEKATFLIFKAATAWARVITSDFHISLPL